MSVTPLEYYALFDELVSNSEMVLILKLSILCVATVTAVTAVTLAACSGAGNDEQQIISSVRLFTQHIQLIHPHDGWDGTLPQG
ncbi:hypothetical protein [Burkholderia sp. HI2714]|uniref:hypothetical protein n=1 Tax=Burkholderia sp. HI2714 TaxID=2015359 RepID=UPI00117E12F5|nr:hypothetical protein [Burkholderia sp. HI2714]